MTIYKIDIWWELTYSGWDFGYLESPIHNLGGGVGSSCLNETCVLQNKYVWFLPVYAENDIVILSKKNFVLS